MLLSAIAFYLSIFQQPLICTDYSSITSWCETISKTSETISVAIIGMSENILFVWFRLSQYGRFLWLLRSWIYNCYHDALSIQINLTYCSSIKLMCVQLRISLSRMFLTPDLLWEYWMKWLNSLQWNSFVLFLPSHIGYSIGIFQALWLVVAAVFGAVD